MRESSLKDEKVTCRCVDVLLHVFTVSGWPGMALQTGSQKNFISMVTAVNINNQQKISLFAKRCIESFTEQRASVNDNKVELQQHPF